MIERGEGKQKKVWGPTPFRRTELPYALGQEGNATPEQRTKALFSQSATKLAETLKPIGRPGMVITIPGTEEKVRIVKVQPFQQVGSHYSGIQGLEPGTYWNARARRQGLPQSLVVTPNEGGLGSCVRIVQAEYFDSEYFDPQTGKKGQFVREGIINGEKVTTAEMYITRYLGLKPDDVSKLKFLDDSDILYVTGTMKRKSEQISEVEVDSGKADEMIRKLFEKD